MQTGHTLAVRRAVATDHAGLAALLSDMQAHYGSPDPPGGAAEIARLLTRTGERLPFALVAERDGALPGAPCSRPQHVRPSRRIIAASIGRPTPPMTALSGSMTGWACRAMTSASIA